MIDDNLTRASSQEYPDCWKFIKITDLTTAESHERILCSWHGGFVGSEMWKISSGNLEVIDHPFHLEVPQQSGTVYHLRKNSQRMSGIMMDTLNNFAKKLGGNINIEVLDYEYQ